MIAELKSLLIVGTARNCGNAILDEYKRLKEATTVFEKVHYYIVESDSSDNTVEQLELLRKKDSHFKYVSLGDLRNKFSKRTERIAYCRNYYLEVLRNDEKYSNAEFVLVADLDGVNNLINKEAIGSCWRFIGWDVCTANQQGIYYDLYALRHPLLSPNNWNEQYLYLIEELGIKSLDAKNISVYSKMFSVSPSCKPISVESAFGGLAIYKRRALDHVKYIGLDEMKSVSTFLFISKF